MIPAGAFLVVVIATGQLGLTPSIGAVLGAIVGLSILIAAATS